MVLGDPGTKLESGRERLKKMYFVTQDPGGTGLSGDFGPLSEGFPHFFIALRGKTSPSESPNENGTRGDPQP